ncbi:hypothetical protein RYD26_07390 [Pasteurellaceae bacterium LIM206]|nr:hypothetical protein [Pasteurellaceae bacterium LIM206]
MDKFIRLQSPVNDLILRTHPYGEIIYFGEHLRSFEPQDIEMSEPCIPNGGLDVAVPMSLAAENGRGNFDSPSVEGHRNGLDWSPVF